jgi:hypothetical protein
MLEGRKCRVDPAAGDVLFSFDRWFEVVEEIGAEIARAGGDVVCAVGFLANALKDANTCPVPDNVDGDIGAFAKVNGFFDIAHVNGVERACDDDDFLAGLGWRSLEQVAARVNGVLDGEHPALELRFVLALFQIFHVVAAGLADPCVQGAVPLRSGESNNLTQWMLFDEGIDEETPCDGEKVKTGWWNVLVEAGLGQVNHKTDGSHHAVFVGEELSGGEGCDGGGLW